MVKNIRHTENQKLFFDEDICSSPNSSKLKDIHSANLTFRKRTEIYSKVPRGSKLQDSTIHIKLHFDNEKLHRD